MRSVFESYTVSELRKFVTASNLKGVSKMKKAELVDLMLANVDRFKHIKAKAKPTTRAKPTSKGMSARDIFYAANPPKSKKKKTTKPKKSSSSSFIDDSGMSKEQEQAVKALSDLRKRNIGGKNKKSGESYGNLQAGYEKIANMFGGPPKIAAKPKPQKKSSTKARRIALM